MARKSVQEFDDLDNARPNLTLNLDQNFSRDKTLVITQLVEDS